MLNLPRIDGEHPPAKSPGHRRYFARPDAMLDGHAYIISRVINPLQV